MKCKKHYADLEKYKEYKKRFQKNYRQRNGANQYKRREWTSYEIERVLAQDIPDSVLAKEIKRSVGAIQHKRSRLRGGS